MNWWNAIKAAIPKDQVTWDQFRPDSVISLSQLLRNQSCLGSSWILKQNGRPVLEYAVEFNTLSKYGLSLIDTPEKKNEKFQNNLRSVLGEKAYKLYR